MSPSSILAADIEGFLDCGEVAAVLTKYRAALEQHPYPDIDGRSSPAGAVISRLKREPFSIGPYERITVFEAANRIASDITLLQGVLLILKQKAYNRARVKVRLGTGQENGRGDFTLASKSGQLEGEAFDVAPSFFTSKLYKTLKKWDGDERLRFIVFNADVLNDRQCDTRCRSSLAGWSVSRKNGVALWSR